MSLKGLRIKLKPNSREQAMGWALEINSRIDESRASMAREGIVLEAAFLDHLDGHDYLICVMKTRMDAPKDADVKSDMDAIHEAFEQSCWESTQRMTALFWVEVK